MIDKGEENEQVPFGKILVFHDELRDILHRGHVDRGLARKASYSSSSRALAWCNSDAGDHRKYGRKKVSIHTFPAPS